VIPIQFVFFTLSAITGSAILYGDFKRAGFHTIITFLYGCGATFVGVFILTNGSGSTQHESDQKPSDSIEDGTRLGMGTIGKRRRATLVLPSGVEESPLLRRKMSGVGLVGISSAQVGRKSNVPFTTFFTPFLAAFLASTPRAQPIPRIILFTQGVQSYSRWAR
jgi:hypothetical protein